MNSTSNAHFLPSSLCWLQNNLIVEYEIGKAQQQVEDLIITFKVFEYMNSVYTFASYLSGKFVNEAPFRYELNQSYSF